MKTLPFTPSERSVIEEAFQPFAQTLAIIAKLKGLRGEELLKVRLLPDRSGLELPTEEKE